MEKAKKIDGENKCGYKLNEDSNPCARLISEETVGTHKTYLLINSYPIIMKSIGYPKKEKLSKKALKAEKKINEPQWDLSDVSNVELDIIQDFVVIHVQSDIKKGLEGLLNKIGTSLNKKKGIIKSHANRLRLYLIYTVQQIIDGN